MTQMGHSTSNTRAAVSGRFGSNLAARFQCRERAESVLPADRSTSREGLDFDESTAADPTQNVPWPWVSPSAPRLSIVVLPFTNLSNDSDQQYFADAITEDLASDLSRIEDMFVISRNTAFTYRNKQVDTKQIGRELGVRYVLEGSVQRSSNQLRVTAQLIDAETDAHLWAEQFDREPGDLFALQNDIQTVTG
jgi:TolB-like protein